MPGVGPFSLAWDAGSDLVDAGERTITVRPTSGFSWADGFATIRGGRVDAAVLGATEVAADGDLAEWIIPGRMVKGMGGAMDPVAGELEAGVERVVDVTDHVARNGELRIPPRGGLPPTGRNAVDPIVTALAVPSVGEAGVRAETAAPTAPRIAA